MNFRLFLATLMVAAIQPLEAQTLPEESRVQKILQSQSGALVRIKATFEVENLPDLPNEVDSDKPKTALKLGTGFFVSRDGLIATNGSLVHKAKRLWYEVDGIPYLAELKGLDVQTNVAILKAKTFPGSYEVVNLADTVDMPGLGSFLLKLSLPMDFGPTPTLGLLQGAESDFGARAFPTRYLRVQLHNAPGEAGSPVFDLQGRFVGMTVAAVPEAGSTYVLPARALNWVREAIVASKTGEVPHSQFGFNAEEVRNAAGGLRLEVKSVEDASAAAKGGLKVGDIIIEAARKPCRTIADLREAVFYTKPGQYLDLKVLRGGNETAIAIQAAAK